MQQLFYVICFVLSILMLLGACSKKTEPSDALSSPPSAHVSSGLKCASMFDDCPRVLVPGRNKPSADILLSPDAEAMENILYDYVASMDIEPIKSLREAAQNGGEKEREAYAVRVIYESIFHQYAKRADITAAADIILKSDNIKSAEAKFLRAIFEKMSDEIEDDTTLIREALQLAIAEKHEKLLIELLEHAQMFDIADDVFQQLKEIYKDGVAKREPEAMYRMADSLESYQLAKSERTPDTPYTDELLQLYTHAAKAGHPKAMLRLGMALSKDEKNVEASLDWLIKAADKGERDAAHAVFNLYADTILFSSYAEGVTSGIMDDSVSEKQFEVAKAAMGSPNDGMRKIAELLAKLHGQTLLDCSTGMELATHVHDHPDLYGAEAHGIETSLRESALQCFDEFAATQGHCESCHQMITMVMGEYLNLDEPDQMSLLSDAQIKRIFAALKRCYALAVALDDTMFESMPYHLSHNYYLASLNAEHSNEKYSVAADNVEEIAQLVYGARHGDPNVVALLALFYEKGERVVHNDERACYWWQRGAEIGLCKACRVLNGYEPDDGDSYCEACGVIDEKNMTCLQDKDDGNP